MRPGRFPQCLPSGSPSLRSPVPPASGSQTWNPESEIWNLKFGWGLDLKSQKSQNSVEVLTSKVKKVKILMRSWPQKSKKSQFWWGLDLKSPKSQNSVEVLTSKVKKVKILVRPWPQKSKKVKIRLRSWPQKSNKSKFGWGLDLKSQKVDFRLRSWPQEFKKSKIGSGFDVKNLEKM